MTHNPFPYGPPPQDHPQATSVLILGVVSLVLCQVLAPVAWVWGNRVLRDIDAAQGTQGQMGGRSSASTGRTLGIVGTVLLVVLGVGQLLLMFAAPEMGLPG